MKKISGIILLSYLFLLQGYAQFGKLSPADSIYWANIRRLNELDYRDLTGWA